MGLVERVEGQERGGWHVRARAVVPRSRAAVGDGGVVEDLEGRQEDAEIVVVVEAWRWQFWGALGGGSWGGGERKRELESIDCGGWGGFGRGDRFCYLISVNDVIEDNR